MKEGIMTSFKDLMLENIEANNQGLTRMCVIPTPFAHVDAYSIAVRSANPVLSNIKNSAWPNSQSPQTM